MTFISRQQALVAFAATAFFFSNISAANAVTIADAGQDRGAFTISGVDDRSYDGAGFNAFLPFGGNTGATLLQMSSFNGASLGTKLEVTLLSNVAWYDGFHAPGVGDSFGVVNDQGEFISLINPGMLPGFSNSIIQGASDNFTFAVQTPDSITTTQGVFSSIDANNPDKAAHIVGMEVVKAGTIYIPQANLWGASLTFDLMVGDIVLFIEDLMAEGNLTSYGVPANGDFDYNDMVVVIRHSAVPEPATMLLIGAGLLSAAVSRRRARTAC